MELYNELLTKILESKKVQITFPGLPASPETLVESESYKALQTIKAILANDSLSDFDCIEEIVCVLEAIGSGGGGRHDFG